MNSRLTHSLLSTGMAVACVCLAQAQNLPIPVGAPPLPVRQAAVMQSPESGVVVGTGGGKEMGFQFVAAEPAVSTQVVKAAPYSLEATVETEQTLADGNRIIHRQIVHLYRDSEGRTRREETLAAIGPWAASGTPPTVVTIQDPVSGSSYSLDPQDKIATRLPKGLPGQVAVATGDRVAGSGFSISSPPDGSKSAGPVIKFNSGAGVVVVQEAVASPMSKADENSQSLGKDVIAGVSADGTRLTTTIPAEAMGNERPITITRERWYSPDLQIVLRSKQSDPRFGVTTYEVTRLERSNPAISLFEVPPDYQIRKMPEPPLPPAPPK
jgi:hypothetical protein